jgi:PBP1b-binding outer membrane lipoprotein LpoB
MVKTMKTMILALVLAGCASAPPPVSNTTDRVLPQPPQDIQFVVSPGWHEGKEIAPVQSLHANPVVKKGPINPDPKTLVKHE